MPGGGGPLQGVLAGVASSFVQLPREGADGVGVGVGVVVDTQQAAFFGVQQEHHTHQHGDGALVHLGRPYRGRQQRLAVLRAVFGVEPADGRHQHLDHRPGLLGQPGGDLFLAVQAGREQRGQGLVLGNAEEPEPAQQCSERLEGVRFVEPGVTGPRGGGGGPTGGGADHCPFGAVGDQPEGHACAPAGRARGGRRNSPAMCRCRGFPVGDGPWRAPRGRRRCPAAAARRRDRPDRSAGRSRGGPRCRIRGPGWSEWRAHGLRQRG